jgi:H/ACA ribonucleoprotein complex subunit 4
MEKSIQDLLKFSIIVIDKPTGPTSFTVSDFVRKKLKLNKTSHFGTLDPMVTGVLPIALGRAVKLTGFFLGEDKEYVGVMHTHKEQKLEELQEIINAKFLGKIKQMVPRKSRVKRQEREREIKRFELIEQDGKDFLFVAEVQGGTYIRKLISDLGELIGGAHMAELRRTRAGIFDEKNIVNLYDFEKAIELLEKGDDKMLRKMLISAESSIKKIMPSVQAKKQEVKKLLTGKPVFRDCIEKIPEAERFAIFFEDDFIEIAKKTGEGEIVARPEFVFN